MWLGAFSRLKPAGEATAFRRWFPALTPLSRWTSTVAAALTAGACGDPDAAARAFRCLPVASWAIAELMSAKVCRLFRAALSSGEEGALDVTLKLTGLALNTAVLLKPLEALAAPAAFGRLLASAITPMAAMDVEELDAVAEAMLPDLPEGYRKLADYFLALRKVDNREGATMDLLDALEAVGREIPDSLIGSAGRPLLELVAADERLRAGDRQAGARVVESASRCAETASTAHELLLAFQALIAATHRGVPGAPGAVRAVGARLEEVAPNHPHYLCLAQLYVGEAPQTLGDGWRPSVVGRQSGPRYEQPSFAEGVARLERAINELTDDGSEFDADTFDAMSLARPEHAFAEKESNWLLGCAGCLGALAAAAAVIYWLASG